jgi:hypothetical protein
VPENLQQKESLHALPAAASSPHASTSSARAKLATDIVKELLKLSNSTDKATEDAEVNEAMQQALLATMFPEPSTALPPTHTIARTASATAITTTDEKVCNLINIKPCNLNYTANTLSLRSNHLLKSATLILYLNNFTASSKRRHSIAITNRPMQHYTLSRQKNSPS